MKWVSVSLKEYWLVVDYVNKMIEICFCNRKMYTINACLATISGSEIRRMLEVLQGIDQESKSVRLEYEYFTMDVGYWNIQCVFHMFDEPVQFYLFTEVFREALAEYLVKMDELKKSSD